MQWPVLDFLLTEFSLFLAGPTLYVNRSVVFYLMNPYKWNLDVMLTFVRFCAFWGGHSCLPWLSVKVTMATRALYVVFSCIVFSAFSAALMEIVRPVCQSVTCTMSKSYSAVHNQQIPVMCAISKSYSAVHNQQIPVMCTMSESYSAVHSQQIPVVCAVPKSYSGVHNQQIPVVMNSGNHAVNYVVWLFIKCLFVSWIPVIYLYALRV